MSASTDTPSPLQPPDIVRRNLQFSFDDVERHWFAGDCHRTRLFDALSLFFPEGERFFIESVKHYRPRLPARGLLSAQVDDFIAQEAYHSREHRRYKAWLESQGIDTQRLDAATAQRLDQLRDTTRPSQRLAITICLEHFTAILADQVLRNDRLLAGAHPQMRRLWRWHALEETEHKAVAFDVYEAALGRHWRSWLLRCVSMLSVTMYFCGFAWLHLIHFVRRDGQSSKLRGWLGLLRYMFVTPGPFLRVLPAWLAWFKPGFHPWQHDNQALIEQARREDGLATV